MQLYLIIYILKRFNHFLIQELRRKEGKIYLLQEEIKERKMLTMVLMLLAQLDP